MKKIYLDGKQCPPGWTIKWYMHPDYVEMDGMILEYRVGWLETYIETFTNNIPVKEIYRGYNSIHYVSTMKERI